MHYMCAYTHTHTHTHTCHEVISTFKARGKRGQKRREYTAVYAPRWKNLRLLSVQECYKTEDFLYLRLFQDTFTLHSRKMIF